MVYMAKLLNEIRVESMYAASSGGCAGNGANSQPTHSRVLVICPGDTQTDSPRQRPQHTTHCGSVPS
jgi:hypothetical protein